MTCHESSALIRKVDNEPVVTLVAAESSGWRICLLLVVHFTNLAFVKEQLLSKENHEKFQLQFTTSHVGNTRKMWITNTVRRPNHQSLRENLYKLHLQVRLAAEQ